MNLQNDKLIVEVSLNENLLLSGGTGEIGKEGQSKLIANSWNQPIYKFRSPSFKIRKAGTWPIIRHVSYYPRVAPHDNPHTPHKSR